ncbi:MAG TPA: hypothetical protein VJ924_16765, partial [Alphaproteobacteria bacterium]|nr:hypothetical protein [Alphaproteobacteria bacterium]
MHLLATQPGQLVEADEAVDLGQTPAELVVLSAADTEIACLAAAYARLDNPRGEAMPRLRLVNLLRL